MPDKVFIDTNILVYYIGDDETKKLKTKDVMVSYPDSVISSQVISEFASVCLSKNLLPEDEVQTLIEGFMDSFEFSPVIESTIKRALQIRKTYKYSFWDCLIVASAMENNCTILFSEDMQDGQMIEGSLKIVNLFKK
jgi:predicted nucleic acid-binding protein